jgi:hypothetical protein
MNWQPINTAPKDGTSVLLYQPKGRYYHECMMVAAWSTSWMPDGIGGYEWENELQAPTHWMPLPLPPTEWIKL